MIILQNPKGIKSIKNGTGKVRPDLEFWVFLQRTGVFMMYQKNQNNSVFCVSYSFCLFLCFF